MRKQNVRSNLSYVSIGGLITLTIISGAVLTSTKVSADETVDTLTVTVDSACTMTATGGDNGSFSATISPGTSSEIAGSTLTTVCNDAEGYSIYAVGYSGDSFDAPTNTQMIGTNSSSINTGTTGPDSYWAMKLSAVTGITPPTILNSFDDYHIIPADYTQIAKYTSNTVSGTSEGASVKTNYKISTSSSQTAGTYTGKVKYVMVHPNTEPAPFIPSEVECDAGKICYNTNAYPTKTIGEMGNQFASNNASVVLRASNFKRDGYGFAGWSDAYDYTTNPNAHFYGPIETITTPSDLSTNGLSLYAIWIPSAGSLQSDGASTCNSLTKAPAPGGATTANLSSVSALTDDRDGNTYAIAKLADNKCWIIENLRLADKDSNNNDINLSSTNTHNPSLPLTNIYDSSTTSNHLSPTSSVAYNATTAPEGWCTSSSAIATAACFNQSRLRTDNTTLFTNNTSSSYSVESNVYSYGNYYNWYSATAGNGTRSVTSGNTSGDICPAGWHLPTGKDASGEFGALDVAMGGTGAGQSGDAGTAQSAKWRSYPNNFLYSGYVYASSVNSRSSGGYYWSSSANGSDYAYFLGLFSSSVNPGMNDGLGKFSGRMVRCVIGV